MNDPENLRQLFDDATADVRPTGTFDDIRTRTQKADPLARRWFLPSIAAAAVVALVLGGVLIANRDKGKPGGNVAAPPDTTVEVERQAPVYFLGQTAQGPKLFRDTVTVTTCKTPECLMLSAVDSALRGTTTDGDYSSPWPKEGITGAVINADTTGEILIDLEADLAERPAGMDATTASLAIQQLVHTAQAALGQELPVRFQLRNRLTDTLLGVPTTDLVEALDAETVEAPVQITSIVNEQKVKPGDLVVKGVASAFEGNLNWELLVGGDAVVRNGVATAEEAGTLSPYDFTIEGLEPGTYTLVVHDVDESGAGMQSQDSKDIVVE